MRSWWKQIEKNRLAIGVIAAIILLAVFSLIIIEIIVNGTGFKGKTLWDWLQLLIIPFVIAIAGYVINLTISRSEQKQ